jgi:hypothetical protein
MPEMLERYSLEEVCALQWKRCVDSSRSAFRSMPEEKVCTVRYETFVRQPEQEMSRIAVSLGLDTSREALTAAVADVSARSIGKGRSQLGEETTERLMPLIGDVYAELGYA